ncbi:MAG: glycosyltransferase [Acidimicrobiales bacterium]
MALATRRLALALSEGGHACDIVVPGSLDVEPGAWEVPVRGIEALPQSQEPLTSQDQLSSQLAVDRPDVVVVAEGRSGLLVAASRVAPTLLHCHVHSVACPDDARYWSRLGRECSVKAGWKCLAMRPLLGCTNLARATSVKPVLARRRLGELVCGGAVGALAISSHQASLLRGAGVESQSVAVLPNLGMRLTPAELRKAAASTAAEYRSTAVYIGRLSKTKGAHLLPALASRLTPTPLRVFGEGYLDSFLRDRIPTCLGGQVPQRRVAGLLQWASSVLSPSLWPEPGGIVGIDAQLFGAPLGTFDIGSASDWPQATLFPVGDTDAMARWAGRQASVSSPRPAELIASAQDRYWRRVASRASGLLEEFKSSGKFVDSATDAVRQDVGASLGLPQPRDGG